MRGWLSAWSVSCIKMAIGTSKTEPYDKNPNLREGKSQQTSPLKAGVKGSSFSISEIQNVISKYCVGKTLDWNYDRDVLFFSQYSNLKSFIFFGPQLLLGKLKDSKTSIPKYILFICITYILLLYVYVYILFLIYGHMTYYVYICVYI